MQVDGKPPLEDVERRSIHQRPVALSRRQVRAEIFETGIKVIDPLCPMERGGKAGLFGGAGVGKTGLFCGIGERCREAEELHRDLRDAGVLDKTIMVFGQMNEPPAVRFRVGHSAMTMATICAWTCWC